MTVRSRSLLCVLAAGCIATMACSSGPSGPTPGTPAFYWSSAQTTFRNGDHAKTATNLSKLVSNPEYAQKAQPWEMILNAGLAQGYMELADRYEAGGRANRGAGPVFRNHVSHYRSVANAAVLQFTESMHNFMDKNKDESITLAFPFPSGSTAEPGQVMRVAKGAPPSQGDLASIEKAMLARGVLLSIANAAGAGDDAAKARELMKSGELKISRQDFLRAMARALYDDAQLYVPSKMDHPQRMKLVCREAKEALDSIKQANKDDLALRKKIDETVKKYKLS
jgi:predicted amidohydrolase YtcJ